MTYQLRIVFPLIIATLFILFFTEICRAQFSHSSSRQYVLYDAWLGTSPEQQGWVYLTNQFQQSTAVRFTENGSHILDTTANQRELAGYFGNIQQPILLERNQGFSIQLNLQVIEEYHASNYRAGFSVIILSNDALGLELAFWENEIWVYDEQFQRAERFSINTTKQLRLYSIEFLEDEYTIYIDNQIALQGPVRDYSDNPLPPNYPAIYSVPNFIFFGNNTSRASSKTLISQIVVEKKSSDSVVLFQNAPNPFQNTTTISFYLDDIRDVKLDVFEVTGRRVASLLDGQSPAGTHSVNFNASHLSAGIYFYRLIADDRIHTQKMLLIR